MYMVNYLIFIRTLLINLLQNNSKLDNLVEG
jgi:hypothetical protein